MNWKKFFRGLGNAAINAVVGAVLPLAVNWGQGAMTGSAPEVSGGTIGMMSAGAAVLGVCNYLVKSPNQAPEQ